MHSVLQKVVFASLTMFMLRQKAINSSISAHLCKLQNAQKYAHTHTQAKHKFEQTYTYLRVLNILEGPPR